MISTVFTDIASGLGSFVPALFKAMLDGFTELFIVQSGETLALTPVGDIALVFIVMGIGYKVAPTVIGWLRLKMSRKGKRRKARA